jgi:hypothetical protein
VNVEISGDHNQVAGGNIINIHHAPASSAPKVKVVIQPGPNHVSDEQKSQLKALVADVVKLEAIARRQPKGFGAVWNALTKRMRATSYHLIKASDYQAAEQFLRKWIGRLSSTKTAAKKDPDWRKRKYSYIFTNVKQLDREKDLADHLAERYQATSARDITDEQLVAVYQTVAGWKRAAATRQAKPVPSARKV